MAKASPNRIFTDIAKNFAKTHATEKDSTSFYRTIVAFTSGIDTAAKEEILNHFHSLPVLQIINLM